MADEPNDNSGEFVEIDMNPAPAGEDAVDFVPPADAEKPEGEGEPDAEKDNPPGDADAEGEDGDGEKDGDDALRDDKGRFKGGAEARIAELTRLRRTAERERDQALAQLKGARDPAQPAPSKPAAADFDDYAEFVEALTDWKADQREASRTTETATSAADRAVQARQDEWQARVAATAPTLANYDEIVGKSDMQIAQHVGDALMDADRGPELAYYLAQNETVVQQLNGMSFARAAMELGRIEATLAAPVEKPKPREVTQTRAPAPITPVGGGSNANKDPAKMSQSEYNAWRKDQLA